MEREIFLYNTLTRRKERFTPRREGEVSIYVCGVTPYDDAHLGHARPSVLFDVVRRFLEHVGYKVRLIQNFTDVDDKIIARAGERGIPALELSEHYAAKYLANMDALGVRRADEYPKVSTHIPEIIAMIEGLVKRGAAYASGGNVFFRVEAFPSYGKLSRQRKEELIAGARVEAEEGKESPLDFALWKAAKPGEPAWESPWGPGRPGWHIECSAMSLKYLGNGFDIHGGGLDLVFPHHENEIAQSEAFTGEEPFVRYWMHNGLIHAGEEKMSKSLGNFVTLDDLLQRYPAEFLRFAMIQQHYRSPMEFSEAQMAQLRKGWERLVGGYLQLRQVGEPLTIEQGVERGAQPELVARARETHERFVAAMCDDFNTPAAVASLFELLRDVRSALQANGTLAGKAPAGASGTGGGSVADPVWLGLQVALGTLRTLGGDILGVLAEELPQAFVGTRDDELVSQLVTLILEVREEARKAKNYAQADRLRDRLLELGIAVEDTPGGARWSFKA